MALFEDLALGAALNQTAIMVFMRKILLIIALVTGLAAQAKPSFFKIASYRFSPNVRFSNATQEANNLRVVMARSNTKHIFASIVTTPLCSTSLDFTDLYDQVIPGAEFDLTTSAEAGKVNISFILFPNGSEPYERSSNSDSIVLNGKVTIIAVEGTKIVLSYSATILNYAEQIDNNGVLESTTVESPIKLSGRYVADTAAIHAT
jgi:hypothetical protein